MRLPVIRGVIDRRILVNYRVDPEALGAILPSPFRPQMVGGYGMAGICLIRLREVRPRGLPRWLGIGSENAAHRVAVEWEERGEVRRGVYVLRRDTNSWFNVLAGGRIFPGVHHRSTFRVNESGSRFEVALDSDDGQVSLDVVAKATDRWPNGSVFASLQEASAFFEAGSLGYSPTGNPGQYDGLELRCRNWTVTPLVIERSRSSVFDDDDVFPRGSAELDCGLLMRGVEHEWHGCGELCCSAATVTEELPREAEQVEVLSTKY